MRDNFIDELTQIVKSNKDIILITGDLGFGVLDNFIKKFPNQFINAGVAEQNMTGIATGLGMDGKIVFTYSIGNFNTLRCLEQIRNDACYHDANVNIVSIGGGFSYGALGYSHHATEDIAILRALPNIRVFSPCDFWEVRQVTRKVVEIGGVNYIRIDKSFAKTINNDEEFIVGKGRVLIEGNDIIVFSTGGITDLVLNAQKKLSKKGIHCKIISMHTIKPIDEDIILESASKGIPMLSVEEHTKIGGLGSAISEVLINNGVFPRKFVIMGLESSFSTIVGSQSYLRKINGLDTESIFNKILSIIK